MSRIVSETGRARAALLAEALSDMVAELRLIEPGDMIVYIRNHQWATIADLVQASSELSFSDGSISFSCMADFSVEWGSPPSISFDLEFQSDAVSAFFTLTLEHRDSVIELKKVWFASMPDDDLAGTDLLARALIDARLSPATIPRLIWKP